MGFFYSDGDTASHGAEIGNPSIGEPSFWNDWDGETTLGRDADRESASTVALAGSLLAQKYLFIIWIEWSIYFWRIQKFRHWMLEPYLLLDYKNNTN